MPLSVLFGSGDRTKSMDFETIVFLKQQKDILDSILGCAVFSSETCRHAITRYEYIVALECARAGDRQALEMFFLGSLSETRNLTNRPLCGM